MNSANLLSNSDYRYSLIRSEATHRQIYARIDKDGAYHKKYATIYAGKCKGSDKKGNPLVVKGNSKYFGSGVSLPKKDLKVRERAGRLEMLEFFNLDYIADDNLLNQAEGLVISTISNRFGDRCINKYKRNYKSNSLRKILEGKAIEEIRKELEEEKKEITEEILNNELQKAKQRVKVWFYRHNKVSLEFAMKNGLLSRVKWTIVEAYLYQALYNERVVTKNAIEDIKISTGVDLTKDFLIA